jgi:anaerobic magnesium-protoporphyrin IX monomethyl ester cyclase
MLVELIHPPHPNSTDDRLDPPLGLLLLASYLREHVPGITVRVNDMSGDANRSPGEADFYGVTSYCTSMRFTRKLAMLVKGNLIVGGANPSAIPDAYHFAKHVVIGPGEVALASIVSGKTKDRVVIGGPVDAGLFPAFDLVDLNSYHRRINGLPSVPILTSRGCPYHCAFCGLDLMHGLSGSLFSTPQQVVDMVQRVIDDCGVRAINFQDDIFTLNRKRLFQLLDLLVPLNIVFRCHGRAGTDNEEVYKRLAESGCKQVSWGIESGSQQILDRMHKQVTVQENHDVIQWAKKYGITARAFFVIGFPGETEETLEETKRFIINADPDQYFVSNFIPYPGTPVWKSPQDFGVVRISKDFDQYYQVGKDGTGGLTIDTQWIRRADFRRLELEFRAWLRENKPRRGCLLDYEKDLEGGEEEQCAI